MKQFNKKTIRQNGFTLIELLIYIAILSVVLVFTGEYLYNIGQAKLSNSARTEIAKNAELLMTKLKTDFSQAASITVPSDSNPTANLQFTLTTGQQVSYQLDSGSVRRTYQTETNELTNNQVSVANLSFQKISNSGGKETIQIRFTSTSLAQMSGGRTVSEDFQTTVSRR